MMSEINWLLTAIPWPPVLLGLAAALSILVIYDVAYVWPLCRRAGALAKRCEALERSRGESAELRALADRLAALEIRGREDFGRLGERLGQLELATEARSYEQAIGCAERGEQPERLISVFGLTEGEANLVTLLHGDRARRPATAPRRAS
jgi:hypothetical protein